MSAESEIIELRKMIEQLVLENQRLQALVLENEWLRARVLELEGQLKMNSKNSSKPPSSDRFKPNLTLRTPSNKKPGGQKGHQGYNLPLSDNPDEVIPLRAETCTECGTSLSQVEPQKVIRRQVVDLSGEKPLKVTEYRSEILVCPSCGKKNGGTFPSHLKSSMEYGPNISGLLMLMVHTHALPYKRVADLIHEILGAKISPGTIVNITKACAKASSEPVETVLNTLKSAPVLHLDETGLRVEGKTLWVHSACTASDSHLILSESRGSKGIDLHLKDYQGTAIHDGWKSYFKYDCTHGLCNAHHLRELKFLFEIQGYIWAKEFFDLLCSTYRRTKDDGIIPEEEQEKIRNRAQEILVKAKAAHPPPEPVPEKKRGRVKRSKALNLINRLEKFTESVWLFITDPNIPFDNNQAERDLRMLKVMIKIKGCFRTMEGAMQHLTIRSLIQSVQKKGQNILSALTNAMATA